MHKKTRAKRHIFLTEQELYGPIEDAIEILLAHQFENEGTIATYKRYLLKYCNFMNVKTLAEILDIEYLEVIDQCVIFLGQTSNPNTKQVVLAALGILFDYIALIA